MHTRFTVLKQSSGLREAVPIHSLRKVAVSAGLPDWQDEGYDDSPNLGSPRTVQGGQI